MYDNFKSTYVDARDLKRVDIKHDKVEIKFHFEIKVKLPYPKTNKIYKNGT